MVQPLSDMSTTRKALQLLAPCSTTGIGSLPHTQGELALQMALQFDVPFLPQLPAGNPSELMIPSALDGLPGLLVDADGTCRVDVAIWARGKDALAQRIEGALASSSYEEFEPSPHACRSLRPFLFEVEARKLPFAKVQISGPATVRWVAKTTDGRPASEVEELDRQIFQLLLAKTMALVRAVRASNATPIVFLDEPGLFALDERSPKHLLTLKEISMLCAAAQRDGALVGMHCCSNTVWSRILGLGLDIISIDARLSLDALLEDQDAWMRFLSEGSTLCLGVIPTDVSSEYSVAELCDSVEAALRATTPRGLPFEGLLARMLLSPACGLGLRSVADAARITAQLREAQERLLDLIRS
jgi:methionine synthase II (cobalamin-independent)